MESQKKVLDYAKLEEYEEYNQNCKNMDQKISIQETEEDEIDQKKLCSEKLNNSQNYEQQFLQQQQQEQQQVIKINSQQCIVCEDLQGESNLCKCQKLCNICHLNWGITHFEKQLEAGNGNNNDVEIQDKDEIKMLKIQCAGCFQDSDISVYLNYKIRNQTQNQNEEQNNQIEQLQQKLQDLLTKSYLIQEKDILPCPNSVCKNYFIVNQNQKNNCADAECQDKDFREEANLNLEYFDRQKQLILDQIKQNQQQHQYPVQNQGQNQNQLQQFLDIVSERNQVEIEYQQNQNQQQIVEQANNETINALN
ncbi:hypothetical protein PPERSA_11111 [Pseudocohnilembus persalinus]|uniref:Uncharacterized protein n=1 Tax=Pseudocohnilembus persalinus TaxID=266149 RepID=A0A0V0QZU1_PSEPJ|nr:hypothetical protein PPERSA_11111 [Pseudocohnilembus persalinus]|eukprot:KRX07562.1 hypothetical protein PPERSA_11111 [Pseudocohnilembus persalinus]